AYPLENGSGGDWSRALRRGRPQIPGACVMKFVVFFLSCVFATQALAIEVENVPNPRGQNLWVTDFADMIDPVVEQKLNQLIETAHQELTIEIAVVTVDTITASPSPKDFATDLF